MENLYELICCYQESNDEFMIKKLEFTRESALLKQQIEFLKYKVNYLYWPELFLRGTI